MKKYNKATKQTIKEYRRKGFGSVLLGVGNSISGLWHGFYNSLAGIGCAAVALLPSIIAAGLLSAGIPLAIKAEKEKSNNIEVANVIIYEMKDSEEFKQAKNIELAALKAGLASGNITYDEYVKGLNYVASDEYLDLYLRTNNIEYNNATKAAEKAREQATGWIVGMSVGVPLFAIGQYSGGSEWFDYAGGNFDIAKEDSMDKFADAGNHFRNADSEFKKIKALKKKNEESLDEEMGM